MHDDKSFAVTGEPGLNEKILFWASFFTLIAAGIGFSVRGEILGDWGQQFQFTQSELGTITGGGLVGFGVTIVILSFFADAIGYGKLMALAFLLHASSAVVTLAAAPAFAAYGKPGAFFCLNVGAWLFSLGNGTCETVINPLTATLFPRNKTHWLNILHAGWPGGLILGALIALVFNQLPKFHVEIRWEYKYAVFILPVLLYGIMMLGRRFPRSEAKVQGVDERTMMGEVGMLGFAVVTFFIGLLLTSFIPALPAQIRPPQWTGWVVAFVIWMFYGAMTRFSVGHLILAFLYLLHAMVGYVELGTDSWIQNIGNTILSNRTYATTAFITTNLVMFALRFFAGPIVHKISPLGLLFVSALLGTTGLVLFSQDFVKTFGLWMAVSTIYAIGKTFYWPTLLGVISERFPKGGALALGLSGGIGMMSAGLLGGPGIGYKQDYFAVHQLTETSKPTYERYKAQESEPARYPVLTDIIPNAVPPVVGLDNAKLKVFTNYGEVLAERAAGNDKAALGLDADITTLEKARQSSGAPEDEMEASLKKLKKWWEEEGEPNYQTDKEPLKHAVDYGAKEALLYTAAVPAAMAIGFLLLIGVFAAMGGYRQVHLEGGAAH